jgi:hypothetical protein
MIPATATPRPEMRGVATTPAGGTAWSMISPWQNLLRFFRSSRRPIGRHMQNPDHSLAGPSSGAQTDFFCQRQPPMPFIGCFGHAF